MKARFTLTFWVLLLDFSRVRSQFLTPTTKKKLADANTFRVVNAELPATTYRPTISFILPHNETRRFDPVPLTTISEVEGNESKKSESEKNEVLRPYRKRIIEVDLNRKTPRLGRRRKIVFKKRKPLQTSFAVDEVSAHEVEAEETPRTNSAAINAEALNPTIQTTFRKQSRNRLIPIAFQNIPDFNPDDLSEEDLLFGDPATHTHPLGSHPLLPVHIGYDHVHSHPPFNDPPVIKLYPDEPTGINQIIYHDPRQIQIVEPTYRALRIPLVTRRILPFNERDEIFLRHRPTTFHYDNARY